MEQVGHMLGVPVELESYQPVCDVLIRFRQHGIFKEYQRGLDLTKALYSQRYIRQEDRLEHSLPKLQWRLFAARRPIFWYIAFKANTRKKQILLCPCGARLR